MNGMPGRVEPDQNSIFHQHQKEILEFISECVLFRSGEQKVNAEKLIAMDHHLLQNKVTNFNQEI
jgi:hypothetical protein